MNIGLWNTNATHILIAFLCSVVFILFSIASVSSKASSSLFQNHKEINMQFWK